VTHSYLTWAAIGFAWCVAFGWDWALLAIPIHLSGDRGVFGNVLKPSSRPFESSLRSRGST
jgi:hypothetical protein